MKTVMTVSPRVIAGMLLIAAKEDVRYYLNGVQVEPESGHLVATDGHRMLIHRCPETGPNVDSFIIPRDVLGKVHAAFKAAKTARRDKHLETVRICIGERAETKDGSLPPRDLVLDCGHANGGEFVSFCTFTAKEHEGRYPDWRRVVPRECSGRSSQFNPVYLCELQDALAEIADSGKRSAGVSVIVRHNGPDGAAPVLSAKNPQTMGILMPLRGMDDGAARLQRETLQTLGLVATKEPEAPTTAEPAANAPEVQVPEVAQAA